MTSGALLASVIGGAAVAGADPVGPTYTYSVSDAVDVGRAPLGVAVDAGTQTAYVANVEDGTVSVIDESSNTVSATIDVGGEPFAAAVDPATHNAYVTNIDDNAVSVIDEASDTVTATMESVAGRRRWPSIRVRTPSTSPIPPTIRCR